ncbi:MAG: RIP metalloprotease RseP [Prolixibacteraceae bacterium]|nr:RIP metalloprotease RseP [Prolixibacteraceae bacterium]MBN2649317.1 RIP metalloprotease RseP [Prolixibacteraceae bacterium]
MEIVVKVAQFLLSLSLLIVIHELGHFIFAKIFKCRVEKFYLFFDAGFSLFKTKRGETEYGIGWIPLGGYVKISGMIDESMDKEQMKQPPQPWEFRSKKAYQRLLIMVGGVLMNFLAAIIIYIGISYAWGKEYLPTENVKYGITVNETGREIGFHNGDKILSVEHEPVADFFEILTTIMLEKAESVQVERNGQVVDVMINEEDIAKIMKTRGVFGLRYPYELKVVDFAAESPAQKAGLKVGDEIVAIDGERFEYYDQFADYIKSKSAQEVLVTVLREGKELNMTVPLTNEGMLGVSSDNTISKYFEFAHLKYSFFEAIPAGIKRGWKTSGDYLKQFKLIFNRTTKGYESLGGFITIGSIFPGMWNWKVFWDMTAFLSIILGIMNILPIPALDGGHVMFVLYEIITGRKPSDKFLEYAQYVGLVLLLFLVLYANINDVVRLFR